MKVDALHQTMQQDESIKAHLMCLYEEINLKQFEMEFAELGITQNGKGRQTLTTNCK